MSVIRELSVKTGQINGDQIAVLEKMCGLLELASDIAHAQVSLYIKARNVNYLVIVAQAKPNTSLIKISPNLLGSTLQATEEPMVWRTMETGRAIYGQREWALGVDAVEMRTFPVLDTADQIIAVLSFEGGLEETGSGANNILTESAYMLLTGSYDYPQDNKFRPLTARDGILIIDAHGQIVFANAAAVGIYKTLGVAKIIGRRVYERQVNLRLAQKAAGTGEPCEDEIEVAASAIVLRAIPIVQARQTVRTVVIISDVTELKKKEKELLIKSAVIQEIHHRVKNNLQTIASLLRLQARRAKQPDVKAALRESVNRILSISVVHEFLSQQDAEVIDVAEVAKNILDLVIQNMMEPNFNIQTVFNGETIIMPSDRATSLALVINELIQNSIEHGFVGREEGIIGIDITAGADGYKIEIYDNGIGLPAGFNPQSTTGSLGLQIVRTLVEEDLGGKFRMFSQAGTHASITIPKIPEGG